MEEMNGHNEHSYSGIISTKENALSLQHKLEKLLLEHLSDVPGVFMGYETSDDQSQLKVQVQQGKADKAKKFLCKHLGVHGNIEIEEKQGKNKFASGQFNPTQSRDKISRGSMAVSLTPESSEELKTSNRLDDKQTFGTITAFMHDKENNHFYGMTSAHVLFETPNDDHQWPSKPVTKPILSYIEQPGNGKFFVEIAKEFYAGMENTAYYEGDDTKRFIDIGIFKVNCDHIHGELIQLDVDKTHGFPLVYEGTIASLKQTEVVKIGAATGITRGKITGVANGKVIALPDGREILLTDMMVVCPSNGEEFGTSGDSGSPVFLLNSDSKVMVGNICAGNFDDKDGERKCHEMYCLPMSNILKYIHKKGLRLEFPQ